MPRSGVVKTFGKLTCCALAFNLFGVNVEGAVLVRHLDFGSVSHCHRLRFEHPFHGVRHVCTGWSLVVLHDASWGEEVEDHIGAEGDWESRGKNKCSIDVALASHTKTLISHNDSFLESTHVLGRSSGTAWCWVQWFHRYLFLIIFIKTIIIIANIV